MTVLPAHTQRIIFHKAMASAHLIAAEFDCSASDVIDIVVGSLITAPESTTRIPSVSGHDNTKIGDLGTTPDRTPSQPEVPTHATAAQADGEAVASQPSSPSVDLSGLAAHEQGPIPSPSPMANGPEPESRPTRSRPSGSGDFLPKRVHGRQEEVRRIHFEHPDWHDDMIAQHLGVHSAYVRTTAKRLGLSLPSRRQAAKASKASTTEAIKAPAKPQEAERPSEAAKAQPQPKQPPATKSVTPRSVTVPNEPRRIVPTHAPVGAGPSTRFYVRDAKGRYLHQSLERSPTDTGPLMTSNRKWAWYDNAQRFAGACRKWPEIADMRKELPNA